MFLNEVDAIVVSWSKYEKDLLCGYRDKGNKNVKCKTFDLKFDKWTRTNGRSNEKTYKRPRQRDQNYIFLKYFYAISVLDTG